MEAKRAIQWAVSNLAFVLLLWMGFDLHIDEARHAAVFWIWLSFALSLSVPLEEIKRKLADEGPSVPAWIYGPFNVLVTAYLVWHGHEILATAYAMHVLLRHAAYQSKTKPEKPS